MKRLFRDAGLPVVPWELVLRRDWEQDPAGVRKRIEERLRYPLFTKPANLGSSVGITKVHSPQELGSALELAARYDRKILVEKALNAREIECAVLGNDSPEASVPGEIIPVNEFYDYEAKYLIEGTELLIPARLTRRQITRVRELAVPPSRRSIARAWAGWTSCWIVKPRKFFVLEINTIPGFTSISMYPKLWEASGIPYSKLLDRLMELALERHADKKRTRFKLAASPG